MATQLSSDLLVVVLSLFLIYGIHKWRSRNSLPLPPGPKGYPIIGNLLDVPSEKKWVRYHAWSKEFKSDIIHVNIMGQDIIILDSLEAAIELMERRSSIYSDRPRMPMLNELMGFDFNAGFAPYGDQWRSQRRLMHSVFHPASSKNLQPHALKAAHSLLRRFLERPGEVVENIRHMAAGTILSITYGIEVQADNDAYIKVAEGGIEFATQATVPGAFLVDFIPALKYVPEWMPGAGFHQRAKVAKLFYQEMIGMLFNAAQSHIDSGNYTKSFVSYCYSHLNEKADLARQEYLIKATGGTMYAAGTDTTSTLISWSIVALLNHPDILRRAQEEIDSVVPFGDLPSFDDEDKLPLVTAICMEALRWKDVAPLGLAHALSADDTYKGYRMPKGSIVFANSWAMLHDDKIYPDPFSFRPERFLEDGKINKAVRDPAFAAFGFGRREVVTIQSQVPELRLIGQVASLIAAFDITKAVDADGNVIEIDPQNYNTLGLSRKPFPFTCSMKPRSKKHEETIRTTMSREYDCNMEWL